MTNEAAVLSTAMSIASNAHRYQFDKGGKPYILHPIRVMIALNTNDLLLMATAVLHDVIEDTDITYTDLLTKGIDIRVVQALEYLTHEKGTPYSEYIRNIACDSYATRVKIEDLRDNSDITRLKGITIKDTERMQKYHAAYLYLTGDNSDY